MIITESFIWINFPKTGSTFAREIFRRIYCFSSLNFVKRLRFRDRWMREELLPETRPRVGQRFGAPTPHGRVTQIPAPFRHLPVVSSLRDPVKRAYSFYTYGDWKKHDQLPVPVEQILRALPDFPNLSFEKYLDYVGQFSGRDCIKVGNCRYALGAQSVDFVSFFAESTDSSLDPPAFNSWDSLAAQLARVRFLDVEDLNSQLEKLLLTCLFAREDVRFIASMPRINESADPDIAHDIHPSTQRRIRDAEWLMNLYYRHAGPPAVADLVSLARPLAASC